jgi:uncharacterized membrane protein YgaE (UPF0421/DUF939 family)
MEAVYLQNSVGKELASALAALHSYGLNSHTDPSQPLKDPIAFLGNYLLEKTRVEQEILNSKASREPLLSMIESMAETTKTYTAQRRVTLISLAKELETREVAKDTLRKIQEDEEKAAELEADVVVDQKEEEEEDDSPAVVEEQEPENSGVETGGRESVAQEEIGGEETAEGDAEQVEEVAE